MKRIEALADAIGYVNESHVPETKAYQNRNPGLLKAGSDLARMASADDENVRIFTSHIGGYKALVDALIYRCGKCRNAPLTELLNFYGMHEARIFEAIDFLQRALKDESISHATKAQSFLEN